MKKLTTLLLTAALALLSLTVAYAKSWDFSLASAVTVGSTQLEAGRYTVKMDGDTAVVTLQRNNKSVKIPAKTAQGTTKYKATMVHTMAAGSATQLAAIDLGGTTTRLEFAQ